MFKHPDCKSGGLCLRAFKSLLTHQLVRRDMFQRRHLNAIHEVMLDVADEVISNENMEAVDVIKLIHDKFGSMLNRTYNGPDEF